MNRRQQAAEPVSEGSKQTSTVGHDIGQASSSDIITKLQALTRSQTGKQTIPTELLVSNKSTGRK